MVRRPPSEPETLGSPPLSTAESCQRHHSALLHVFPLLGGGGGGGVKSGGRERERESVCDRGREREGWRGGREGRGQSRCIDTRALAGIDERGLQIGTLMAALPGTCCYRMNTGTGWPGVSIL